MIAVPELIQVLERQGVGFFTGVPDSLLSSFSAGLQELPPQRHLVAANEGAALALAAGYQLATGGLPLVSLQNSGLGNLVNPLTSLADKTVYSVPMILMIGWRGQPGTPDEPQHARMGGATVPLLETLEVPVYFLRRGDTGWTVTLEAMAQRALSERRPVALLVEKGAFAETQLPQQEQYPLSSSDCMARIGTMIPASDKVVCSTGKIGRVFYEWNKAQAQPLASLLNIGAMGHTGSLAASLALHSRERVWLFDGDGALLMHLGALPLVAHLQLENLVYIVLNNGAHESVGRQPTLGFTTDLCAVARACGFRNVRLITNAAELDAWVGEGEAGGSFVEIRINTFTPAKLARPAEAPRDAGDAFRSTFQNHM